MNTVLSFFIENLMLFALLFAGVWLIKRIFSKQLSAAMHYLLWGVVMLKLLIPVGLPSDLSPLNLLSQADTPAAAQMAEQDQPEQELPSAAIPSPGNVTLPKTNSSPSAAGIAESSGNSAGTVKSVALDWTVIALIVWAGGAFGVGGWLVIGAVRLKKLEKAQGTEPSARIQALFESCRKQMHIQREIHLVLQEYLPVPAITGVRSPVLFLPASLSDERDEQRLRHIFFHELSHYKRGDIIVTNLLNMLNALYWFNPLVWLVVRLINRDMETACDATVLTHLGLEKRQGYIETVIEFGGNSNGKRLVPALWMNDGSMKMKSRIRGMFLRSRTKAVVKIPVIAAALVLALVCLTTACQPTPEKAIVVNKGDDTLANEISATPAPREPYQAPAQYKQEAQSFYDGMLSVSFDMQVETPDVSAYPVYTVQDADLTQDQVNRIVSALTQDKPLKYYDDRQTKQEITDQFLLPAKKELSDAKNGKTYSDERGNITVDQLQDNVDNIEGWIADAPETKDERSVTAEEYTSAGMLSAFVDLGKPKPATLKITKNGQSFSYVQFINGTEYIYNGFWEPAEDLPLKTTKEQAVAMATQLVANMGADGFQLDAVGKTTRLGSEFEISSEEYQNTMAYSVVFTRTVDGIPLTYTPIDSVSMSEKDADGRMDAEMWSYERIMINIDDDGIANVFWNGNLQVGTCVNENVQLLPFEDIASRAMDQIKVQSAFLTDQGADGEGIHMERIEHSINRAKLGFARIRVKDSGGYQIVPVWDFYGTSVYYFNEDQVNAFNKEHEENLQATESSDSGYRAIVTINAIDGSAINRDLGY